MSNHNIDCNVHLCSFSKGMEVSECDRLPSDTQASMQSRKNTSTEVGDMQREAMCKECVSGDGLNGCMSRLTSKHHLNPIY